MKRVLKWLDENLEEVALSLLLSGIVISMSVHVFFRYVLDSPLSWTEELTRYLFIWFVFMGMSYGIKKNLHLRVNILEAYFPRSVKYLSVFQDIVFMAFILYLIPVGWKVSTLLFQTGQTSPGLKVKMAYIYIAFLVGLILSLIRMVQRWIKKYGNRGSYTSEEPLVGEEK